MDKIEYLSTEQAATYTGLSASWLAKLRVYGGSCPYIKAGRKVAYRRSDLDAWLDSHRRKSTSEVN